MKTQEARTATPPPSNPIRAVSGAPPGDKIPDPEGERDRSDSGDSAIAAAGPSRGHMGEWGAVCDGGGGGANPSIRTRTQSHTTKEPETPPPAAARWGEGGDARRQR